MQTAAKLVLEPIFEAASNPLPMATDRVAAATMRSRKCTDCSARGSPMWWTPTCRSISIQFRTINNCYIRSRPGSSTAMFQRLIKAWLKAPVEETDPDGRRRISSGKQSTCGTPQGGVISPLLANRYMNRFLRHWRNQGRGEARVMALAAGDAWLGKASNPAVRSTRRRQKPLCHSHRALWSRTAIACCSLVPPTSSRGCKQHGRL